MGLLCPIGMKLHAQKQASALPASIAVADASCAYHKRWQAFHNPAVLGKTKNLQTEIAYNNRFQLKELSTEALSFCIPNRYANIGLAVSHFGYEQYNETMGGIALAKTFSDKLSIGLQANYYSILLSPETGYKGTIITQIGILSELFPNYFVGFHAFNPAQTNIKLGLTEKRIPSVFSLGMSYLFGENLNCMTQIDKEVEYDPVWRTGFEYQLIKQLAIRAGGYGNPFVPSLGCTLTLGKVNLSLNFERHTSLGINSFCGLAYDF